MTLSCFNWPVNPTRLMKLSRASSKYLRYTALFTCPNASMSPHRTDTRTCALHSSSDADTFSFGPLDSSLTLIGDVLNPFANLANNMRLESKGLNERGSLCLIGFFF